LISSVAAAYPFENTPVNYQTGQPAVDYPNGSGNGHARITANKGLVVALAS
jgi:hypothetical protein